MSISRPFAYNPTFITDSVSSQYGPLSVGFQNQAYGNSPGGLKWWNGPNEELGYVIATSQPTGGKVAPDGIVGNVRFWRTVGFSNASFISLANRVTNSNFTSVNEAITWLNANGYWVSISPTLSEIILGGAFTQYYYSPNTYLTRLNTDGSDDTSFVVGNQFNFSVYTTSLQLDGKIIVGGQFTSYSGISSNRIARLNTDGSYDSTFNIGTGFTTQVSTTSIQSDSKIVVGGQFTAYSGTARNRIARLNTNGSYDTSFVIGTGFNAEVSTSTIQSDSKIIVGGNFTSYQGTTRNRIARLNTDGSYDTSFVIGTGFNAGVSALSIQSDGKIIVGGDFTTYQGVTRNFIARLNTDGSYDSTFVIGTAFTNIVTTSSIQSDGKIIIGGGFTSYSGISVNKIIRLNTDGSYDNSFVIGTGFVGTVYKSEIQSNGKIVVGGEIPSYSGISSNNIARLNTDGSYDFSFAVGTGFNDIIRTVSTQSDNKIIVGGLYTAYQAVTSNRILAVDGTDGISNNLINFGTGFGFTVYTYSFQSDKKIIVGGSFSSYQGISSNYIARLNTDGSYDTSFVVGTGFDLDINSSQINSDGNIIVGGDFTTYKGVTRNRIARLTTNGNYDTSFVIGTGFNDSIETSQLQSDGKIIVAGFFTTYSAITTNRIARLNTNGSYDTTFSIGTGFDNAILSSALQSDGKIIVGGVFNTYSGITTGSIARLNTNGSYDSTFNLANSVGSIVRTISPQTDGKVIIGGDFQQYQTLSGAAIKLNSYGANDTSFTVGSVGFNSQVNNITVQTDNKVIVGGGFTDYQGTSRNRIVRLNTDGSYDTSFVIGTGFGDQVFSAKLQSDNKIIVGGLFGTYQGATFNRIIRLNTDGSADTSFNSGGAGFNQIVYDLHIQSDGKVITTGNFTTYNATSRNFITRINTDGVIDSTYNVGTGFNLVVRKSAIQSDEKIIAGGQFTSFDGTPTNFIARINTDGSYDSTFNIGTGFNYWVYTISVQSDGKVLVGGLFTAFQGVSRNRLVRLNTDGSYDSTFNIGTGFDTSVFSSSIQSDGKVVVGGNFTTYQGTARSRIARLNTDGSLDTSFIAGFNNTLLCSTIDSGNTIYVGGQYTAHIVLSNYIARLNSNGGYDGSFQVGTGFNNNIYSSSVQSDGKILVGGFFTTYQNMTKERIVMLNTDGSPDESFDLYLNNGVYAISNIPQ